VCAANGTNANEHQSAKAKEKASVGSAQPLGRAVEPLTEASAELLLIRWEKKEEGCKMTNARTMQFLRGMVTGLTIASAVWCHAAVYDEFNGSGLEAHRWQVFGELDQRSIVQVRDGHLAVFGNGKWRDVRSVSVWRLPREGQNGTLTATFKVCPFFHTVGGNPLNIYDSSVGLIEETERERHRSFGFLLTWPEHSDGGKYKVRAGDDWVQTQQPFTNSLKEYDFLRIRIGRREGRAFCELLFSKDASNWIMLYSSTADLPGAVRIAAASCWGALAVDSVEVAVEGAVQEESRPMTQPTMLPPKLLPFVYAIEVPKGLTPNLDGKLDDAIWGKAQKVMLAHRLSTEKPPTQATTVQVAYDRENLYIAFDCHEERMDLLRIAHKDPSGPVWQDDCVEVFIQPDPAGQWFYYFHAVVNPLGVGWDDYGYHRRWRCSAQRGEKGWTAEVAIPFATMDVKPPKPGECLGINFCREERPHDETTSWAPVKGGFHEPERLGRIVFGFSPVRLQGIGLMEAEKEPKQLMVALAPDMPIPVDTAVTISLAGQSVRLPVAQTDGLRYTVPTELPAGPYRCGVRLTAPQQPKVETTIPFYHPGRGGLTSALWPVEVYNNTFYIADGQLAYFWLLVSDTRGRQQGYEAVIEVPEWMEVLDPPSKKEHGNCPEISAIKRNWTIRDGRRYRQIITQVTTPPSHATIDQVELWMQPLLLWFKAQVPKSMRLPHQTWLYTTVRRNDEEEPTRKTPLVILPQEEGRQPRRIPIYIWLHGPAVPATEWAEMLAHYQKLGVTGLQEGVHDERFDALAQRYGVSTMRSLWWFWWAPNYLKGHPGDAAINAEGKPADSQLGMVCPEVLLAEGSEAFEEAFNTIVTQDKGSPIGWNWDLEGPGVWEVCFCHRCLEAFRQFGNVEAERPLDFDTIRSDPKLREQWVQFALGQTERMVKKWSERIEKQRPGAGLYINSGPPVHEGVIFEGRMPWRDVLPSIRGGMFFRYCNSPVASATTLHQESVRSLERVGHIGTPLWAMLSAGYNRVDSYIYHYPELTALQMVQHVAIGYRGIHFWSYRGFDGRFNNALARASSIIAEFEDWFLDGKKVELSKDSVIAPEMVLPIAWEHKGRLAIFLLNFDPRRDAEVRIITSRLPAKRKSFMDARTRQPVSLAKPMRVGKLGMVIWVSSELNWTGDQGVSPYRGGVSITNWAHQPRFLPPGRGSGLGAEGRTGDREKI